MTSRYARPVRWLHWLLALLLLAQFAFGFWLSEVPRNTPERGLFINLHKTSGLLIGSLILLRIFFRLKSLAPPLPLPGWQKYLAKASHFVLYFLMLLMPLSGYLAANFSKHGVKLFNRFVLPAWGPDDKFFYTILNQTHKVAALLLLSFIALHLLAAAWHGLRRDGIFSRISLRPF